MVMHIDDIITTIDNYLTSIDKPCNVVEFGYASTPSAPYIVVRQEGNAYRIITHMRPGQQSYLRELVRKDLQNALSGNKVGNTRLYTNMDSLPGQIVANNNDGTISQERLFYTVDFIS